jgi:AraC-like DNA-binding protein
MLPLTLCRAIRTEAFSPPLFAALSSPNFLVAVQRIARYKALVAPMRLDVREDTERVTLCLVWPDRANQPPASLVATELLFFVTLARMGTREPVRPLQVATTAPPGPAADYAEFLGVSIRTGTAHELVFAQADAQRPFLTSSEGLWAAFEPELRTRLAQLDAAVTVGQRTRAALLEALPSGLVGMQAVSARLAMSTRSLQRHLESEGLSYQQLLQETRQAVARHYLQKTDLPAAEISFLLGFEEPNSFYRAFRGWTGHTPERVRQQSRAPS